MHTNTSFPTLTQVQVQFFILPKQKQQELDPLVEYLYAEHYVNEIANSRCRRCKVKRTRRICAQGEFGKHGNPCTLAFDYYPNCLRVKADIPHQKKLMALVRSIKPLAKEYVERKKKFQDLVNSATSAAGTTLG